MYQGCENIFTDGSKQGSAVASAALSGDKILVKRLPNNASIFSAEASAILLAPDMISQTSNLKFLILSDSLSCINSIENKDLQNPFIVEILERLHELLSTGVCITFVWVPSHIGIAGNSAADATTKAALCLEISNSLIPYSDLKPLITSHLNNCWQQSWNAETNNKLHRIQPLIRPPKLVHLPRRDEVIIHRLHVDHTHLTHSYLLHKENPPECDVCHCPLTVEHFLVSCSKHELVRRKYLNFSSLDDIFTKVSPRGIVDFIKEIAYYHKM